MSAREQIRRVIGYNFPFFDIFAGKAAFDTSETNACQSKGMSVQI
jgi:hypothetical protein